MKNELCNKCEFNCKYPCAALNKLNQVYHDLRFEEKSQIIKDLRKELNIWDYEVADDIRDLAEKVINKMPELSIIKTFGIKIGYIRSYFPKKDKGKEILGECRKVKSSYLAYIPYDFLITIYEPNIYYMTENQIKILLLHELSHIGLGERGLTIVEHDIADFKSILYRYGIDWNGLDSEVPDILEEKKPKRTRKNK